MTDEDGDVRRFVAVASTALVAEDAARIGLQPSHFRYEQHQGQQYYGYYNFPYPEEQKFIGIIPWMLRILKLCTIGVMLLSSSVTIYGAFYWAVMPGSYASRPLFFDYTGTVSYPYQNVTSTYTATATTTDTNSHDNQESQQVVTSSPVPASTASASTERCDTYTPWASVDLFAIEQAVSLGETIYSDLIPPPTTKNRILQPRQAYYVEILLELPESHLNRQLGMFGVAVDLISHPNQNGTMIKLASSVRPARLPFESHWLAIVRKLVWVVPLVFGGMKENRVIVITSFRHMLESQNYPLRHVVTRLVGQTSLFQQHGPEHSHAPPVEVVFGEVRIGKELNQWQQVLKDWFYTCYVVGTVLLFGAQIGAWVILQYYWGENKDDFEPYFDPSCDFSVRHAVDFESIRSSENDEHNENQSNGEEYSDVISSGGSFDEDSDDWEECPQADQQEDEAPPRQPHNQGSESNSFHRRPAAQAEEASMSDNAGVLPNGREGAGTGTGTVPLSSNNHSQKTTTISTRTKRRKTSTEHSATDSTSITETQRATTDSMGRSTISSTVASRKCFSETVIPERSLRDIVDGLDAGWGELQGLSAETTIPDEQKKMTVGDKGEQKRDKTGISEEIREDFFFDCTEESTTVAEGPGQNKMIPFNDTSIETSAEILKLHDELSCGNEERSLRGCTDDLDSGRGDLQGLFTETTTQCQDEHKAMIVGDKAEQKCDKIGISDCFLDCTKVPTAEAEGAGRDDKVIVFNDPTLETIVEISKLHDYLPCGHEDYSKHSGLRGNATSNMQEVEAEEPASTANPRKFVEKEMTKELIAAITLKDSTAPVKPMRFVDDNEGARDTPQASQETDQDIINGKVDDGPENAIFQVPEAQVLDSFLRDLINPFVR